MAFVKHLVQCTGHGRYPAHDNTDDDDGDVKW